MANIDLRIWVLTPNDTDTNLVFHTTSKGFMSTFNHIHSTHSWLLIKVYDKKSNQQLKVYYNYDNRKVYPIKGDL